MFASQTATQAGQSLDYEQQRLARIAENKKRLEELGIHTSVAALNETVQVPKPTPQPRKRKQKIDHEDAGPVRRSGRLQGGPSLDEDEMFRNLGIDRLDLLPTRRRRTPMEPAALAALREQRLADNGGGRSGLDSGLGVRLQGGRVYDSKLGVTCHWCRQKTLEEHVECTAEGCGGGSRLPVAFCRMCLRNRHGEDVELAIASNCWVCPACRGSCGPGCTTCCNCGPCRKKAGLGPTHQLIKQARSAGFDNVHDYLVYRATGESAEEIADRKSTFSWGAWMDVLFEEEITENDDKAGRTPSVEKEVLATNRGGGGGELSESGSEEESHAEEAVVQPVPTASKRGARKGTRDVRSNGLLTETAKHSSTGTGRVTRKAGLATRGAVVV
ncbi:hypothetical protein Ndes2437B_g06791 [Nannochloris sp. 'desiccata']